MKFRQVILAVYVVISAISIKPVQAASDDDDPIWNKDTIEFKEITVIDSKNTKDSDDRFTLGGVAYRIHSVQPNGSQGDLKIGVAAGSGPGGTVGGVIANISAVTYADKEMLKSDRGAGLVGGFTAINTTARAADLFVLEGGVGAHNGKAYIMALASPIGARLTGEAVKDKSLVEYEAPGGYIGGLFLERFSGRILTGYQINDIARIDAILSVVKSEKGVKFVNGDSATVTDIDKSIGISGMMKTKKKTTAGNNIFVRAEAVYSENQRSSKDLGSIPLRHDGATVSLMGAVAAGVEFK